MKIVTILYHNKEINIPNSDGKLFGQIDAMIVCDDIASVTADNSEGTKIILAREAMLNSIILEKDE